MLDGCAFVTLVTNEDYALGALALARSLQAVKSSAPLVVLVSKPLPDGYAELEQAGCIITEVAALPLSEDFRERHNRQSQHARSPFTKGTKPIFHDPLDNFCKLRLWEMEQYKRIVFLDADTLVVKNIDQLFGYPEFCAAPNLYQELADMHRMNSGVFVASPSRATFEKMLTELDQPNVFWRRTDQSFLESFFLNWHGLPYIFNTLQYVYFNLPELWHWPSIRVLHYQYEKPWQKDHPKKEQLQPLIDLWYQVLQGGPIPESVR